MSNIIFSLSPVEGVKRLRDLAESLLEIFDDVRPELLVKLAEKARSFQVHKLDLTQVLLETVRDKSPFGDILIARSGQCEQLHLKCPRCETIYTELIRRCIKCRWVFRLYLNEVTDDKLEATRHIIHTINQQQQAKQDAARIAKYIWRQAEPALDHQYLVQKGIEPHSTRVGYLYSRKNPNTNSIEIVKSRDPLLLIPIVVQGKGITSLQFINPDGIKWFITDSEVKGGCFLLGKLPSLNGRIVVAEGFATSASIHEATNLPVIVAFSCGNFRSVAVMLRKEYPEIDIIMAADDDYMTRGNPGLTKARRIAREVNGLLAIPVFPRKRAASDSDFNDLFRQGGACAVKSCIENASNVPTYSSSNAIKQQNNLLIYNKKSICPMYWFGLLLFTEKSRATAGNSVAETDLTNMMVVAYDFYTELSVKQNLHLAKAWNDMAARGAHKNADGNLANLKLVATFPQTSEEISDYQESIREIAKYIIEYNGRFVINVNTVLDNKTGILWSRDANLSLNKMSMAEASLFEYSINQKKMFGRNTWRIPTISEMESLIEYAQSFGIMRYYATFLNAIGFHNVQSGIYWSNQGMPISAECINFKFGSTSRHRHPQKFFVWAICDKA